MGSVFRAEFKELYIFIITIHHFHTSTKINVYLVMILGEDTGEA